MEKVKIKRIDIENLKAVSSFTAIFHGKSAHITGGNGTGKSTVLRTFSDRLKGLIPSIITKIGEKEGKTIMYLTDGSRFEWHYNADGQDMLQYYAPNSLKAANRKVFKEVCDRYFPNRFDINRFLTTTEPKKRLQMISELINVDLSEVSRRYNEAYDIRREAKRDLKQLEAQMIPNPVALDTTPDDSVVNELKNSILAQKEAIQKIKNSLNALYLQNRNKNRELKDAYDIECEKIRQEWKDENATHLTAIEQFNQIQRIRKDKISNAETCLQDLYEIERKLKKSDFYGDLNSKGLYEFIQTMPKPEDSKPLKNLPDPILPPEPEYIPERPDDLELKQAEAEANQLQTELSEAQDKAAEAMATRRIYMAELKRYADFQRKIVEQQEYVDRCQDAVFQIENEIKAIVSGANIPDDFSIDITGKNDILFRTSPDADYLPITNETLASSAIFIAAFRLQSAYISEFCVVHFDVSYLDYENRKKVSEFANQNEIQLLTESPASSEAEMELQCTIYENYPDYTREKSELEIENEN